MDLTAEVPVTLVVKAANQRIADQTVECVLGWTIRKLKQHLENVYPSKPKHHQQKLIYSGQLLADHLTLKEVLRQYDSENSRHTVHLVCSPSVDALLQPSPAQSSVTDMKQESTGSAAVSASSSSSSSSSAYDMDGLRCRSFQSQSTSIPDLPNAGANPAVAMPGMLGVEGMPMMGLPGFTYTPEQLAWMQEMYSQYMANYMQYYGYQPYVPPQTHPSAAPVPEQPANRNDVNNGQPNQNMRMNAQGGLEEDEEELEHRDWLDYLYVFFRFLVLLSIVYFYSSATRFVAVSLGFLFIYMLQNGWLNNQQQQQQRVPQEPAEPPQQQPFPRERQQNEVQTEDLIRQGDAQDAARPAGEGSTTEAAENETSETPAEQPQNEIPSTTEVLFRMFTTFFSSLIPARPPAVNGN